MFWKFKIKHTFWFRFTVFAFTNWKLNTISISIIRALEIELMMRTILIHHASYGQLSIHKMSLLLHYHFFAACLQNVVYRIHACVLYFDIKEGNYLNHRRKKIILNTYDELFTTCSYFGYSTQVIARYKRAATFLFLLDLYEFVLF